MVCGVWCAGVVLCVFSFFLPFFERNKSYWACPLGLPQVLVLPTAIAIEMTMDGPRGSSKWHEVITQKNKYNIYWY